MTSSFHIGGFWFHVKWDGKKGVDQRGNVWTNPGNPKCENKLIEPLYKVMSENINAIGKIFSTKTS